MELCLGLLCHFLFYSLRLLLGPVLRLHADLSATPFLLEVSIIIKQSSASLLKIFKVLIVLQSKRKLRSGLFKYLLLHFGKGHTDGSLLVNDLSQSFHSYPHYTSIAVPLIKQKGIPFFRHRIGRCMTSSIGSTL